MPLAATHALIPALMFYSLGYGKVEILLSALGGIAPDFDFYFDLFYKRKIHPSFSHSFIMGLIISIMGVIFPILIPFSVGYVSHLLLDAIFRPLTKEIMMWAIFDGIVILLSILYLFLL